MTQALAFVSGVGAPAATMLTAVDCGGSASAQADGGDDGNAGGGGVMTPHDGSALGVVAMPQDAGVDTTDEVAMMGGGGVMTDTGVPNDATRPPSDGAPFDVVIPDVATAISIPPDAAYDGQPMDVITMRDASNDSSIPTCQGSTGPTGAGSAACNSCLQSNCGSLISALQSACGAYFSCYEGCQCTDTNCLLNCVTTTIDSTCANAAAPEEMCLQQNCQSQCNTSVSSDGGSSG